MGHYSEQYEADDRQRREDRLKRAAKDYAEIKDALDKVEIFIHNWGGHRRGEENHLSVETALIVDFKKLKRTITAWRYQENLLIDNPEVLLDKLKN